MRTDDAGNAVLEFVVLAAFVMVPLIYIIVAVLQVQSAAYGVTEATREAGRAFVEAKSVPDAYRQACAAATVALRNQAASLDCATQLKVTCVSQSPCIAGLVSGQTVRVEIDLAVGLPFLPATVFGKPLSVPVHGLHDEVVDEFRRRR